MSSKKKVRQQQSRKTTNNTQHSTLQRHKREGKTLTPPLATLPQMGTTSWLNNRLPEMLWAALLISHLPRELVLEIFREFGNCIFKFRDTDDPPYDISLSGLSQLKPEILQPILKTLTQHSDAQTILRSLLVLEDLPAKSAWQQVLGDEVPDDSWIFLMVAVARMFNHQSQESTDCRWVCVLCGVLSSKVKLPNEEFVKEILQYPNYGDLRQVRPTIRAMEMGVNHNWESNHNWSRSFWSQCLKDTKCIPLPSDNPVLSPVVGTTSERVKEVYTLLKEHFYQSISTTAVDAKHDTIYGYAFYTIGLLQELLRIGASQSITARIALRTLVECLITLTYLIRKNDVELWKSHRAFGAGQAKLQYLKLEDMEDAPTYVSVDTLQELANEDVWEELLPINIGHWSNSDLRKMSDEANVKADYDMFYGWTSSFAHGHWGSLRDVAYDTCGNPLHRLHRIPRESARLLPDVVPDACALVDRILEMVEQTYSNFSHRVSVGGSQQ